jgi:UDP-glucose 4-epimerase
MKILVTGGNGYIAKSFVKKNKNKYNIKSISRNDFDLSNTIETKNFFDVNEFDIVIHTAIKGGSRLTHDSYQCTYENLLMFDNLLSNKNKFKKLINIGSGAEIYNCDTPYGLSKKIINNLIEHEDNFFNLRVFGIFNEDELDTRFIKSCIVNCINNKNINIHQDKFFDFFYMEDFLKIIDLYLAEKIAYKNFDCCYKEKKKLSDIAKYICNFFKKTSDDFILKLNDNIGESYTGNFTELNNIHFVGLNEGINRVSKILRNSF